MDKCTKDETGKKYGRWLVIEPSPAPPGNKGMGAWWLCECECDNQTRKIIRGGTLREGLSLSCGCWRAEKAKKQRIADTTFRTVLGKIRSSAIQRKIPFTLSLDDIKSLVTEPCNYCGALPNSADARLKRYNFAYNGLDRIDNLKGYQPDNVVACCTTCNTAKSQQTVIEFEEWAKRVCENFHRRNNKFESTKEKEK